MCPVSWCASRVCFGDSDIIKSYNIISITYHPYADDSQVYVAFKTNDASSIKNRIECSVGNICRWMNRNDLIERT